MALGLRLLSTGEAVACQVDERDGQACLSWILPACRAGDILEFAPLAAGEVPAVTGVGLQAEDGRIGVSIGGSEFTAFHYGDAWARPFLHPLIGPYGDPVTRAYPVVDDVPGESRDHPHHKSFWVAWGDVNGSDNWSESEGGHGTQRVRATPDLASGPVWGRISCSLDWLSEQGEALLSEDRDIVVWNTPVEGRLVDVTVRFRATAGAVVFGDTKEGGICSIRVASSMDAAEAGTIVNSFGGTNESETWGKRAHWCDYVGPVAGKTVGIAIFDHPENLRHPTYWHVRNYGLMTANPFGLSHFHRDKTIDGSYRLEAGEELTFRYRVLVHAGDTVAAGVAREYHAFINPPRVEAD